MHAAPARRQCYNPHCTDRRGRCNLNGTCGSERAAKGALERYSEKEERSVCSATAHGDLCITLAGVRKSPLPPGEGVFLAPLAEVTQRSPNGGAASLWHDKWEVSPAAGKTVRRAIMRLRCACGGWQRGVMRRVAMGSQRLFPGGATSAINEFPGPSFGAAEGLAPHGANKSNS